MKYCKSCLTTDLRPNASFNKNGICKPCEYSKINKQIDFSSKEKKLLKKISRVKKNDGVKYDCIIGVSGGKDSTRQALWVRERLGLMPLLICCAYPPRQMISKGAENLANLIDLGFDLEVFNPAPKSAAELSLETFRKFGNVCKASEIALFSTVPKLAIEKGIKIIFFGENPALQEGDNGALGEDEFDGNNLRGLNTLSSGGTDWIEKLIGSRNSQSYNYPSEKEFSKSGIQIIFLGPAWPDWNMEENAIFSVLEGLKTRPNEENITGDITNASMLDEEFTNINMMIKYYKFGFGRATDICNELIRANRINRKEAINIVERFDGVCADEIIEKYCRWVNIEIDEFWNIVNRYTNKSLFDISRIGRPQRKFKIGKSIEY